MERMGTLRIDVLNRTATLLLDQGNKGQAIEVLLRSLPACGPSRRCCSRSST